MGINFCTQCGNIKLIQSNPLGTGSRKQEIRDLTKGIIFSLKLHHISVAFADCLSRTLNRARSREHNIGRNNL